MPRDTVTATLHNSNEILVRCADPKINHLDRHGYLFGYPIAHSMSPLFHQTIFDHFGLLWSQLPLPSTDIAQFLRLIQHPQCFVAIIPHLHDVTPECRAVGACNTVFWRGSKLVGTNTDIVGIRGSFENNVQRPDLVYHDRPGMVIGGGGAARSAVYALVKLLKCTAVYMVNRDAGEVQSVIDWCRAQGFGDNLVHVSSIEQANQLEAPGAVVACVPNFPPVTESEKMARTLTEILLNKPHKGALLEMCYHPTPWTEIAAIAELAGWQVILGTEAVIYQGLEQQRCWTGIPVSEMPLEKVKNVIAQELRKARL